MKSTIILAAFVAVFAGAGNAATVVIDDFATVQTVLTPNAFGFASTSTVAEANALGGARTITAAGNGTGFPSATSASTAAGVATVSNASGVTGSGLFEYTSTSAIDLTSGGTNNAVRVGVTEFDLNTRFQLTLGSETVTKFITGTGVVDFLFSDFLATDLASIFDVKLKVGGLLANTDTSFTFFGAVDTSPVPLPAGLPLLLIGLGALTLARRGKFA